jgi:hypothetical protein
MAGTGEGEMARAESGAAREYKKAALLPNVRAAFCA